jgi:chlorobactene glucosyltransferase
MHLFLLFLPSLALIVIALIAILNALTFPRLRKTVPQGNARLVSAVVPMRNEADVIAETVRSLLSQDYPNLEILLLDDQSTDDTVKIAKHAAGNNPRLKILNGESLPAGWLGKPWACHQLSQHANGEYLLFTDADVRWEPNGITALMREAERSRADLLTAWATQITETWTERLVVPMMGFAIQAYLPIQAVHHIPFKFFAAANGQCLLFRRDAYQHIGGHTIIKNNILDDMGLAYAVKEKRLRLRAVEANGLIRTRMYCNWNQVRDGFAKNILAGHGNNPILLFFSTIFHWWLFILPPFCLLLSAFCFLPSAFNLLPSALYLTALSITIRALTAAVTRQRIIDSLFMPVSVLLMTVIAARSIRWHFTGGPQWKGRTISK